MSWGWWTWNRAFLILALRDYGGAMSFNEPQKRPVRRSHSPEPIEAVLGRALEQAGVPSARVTKTLRDAWLRSAAPAWRDHTRLRRIRGGVLEIAVASSVLRDELVNYHRERLLRMLREAAPSIILVGLRFVLDPAQFMGRSETPGAGPLA